jgi:hypothetical protein
MKNLRIINQKTNGFNEYLNLVLKEALASNNPNSQNLKDLLTTNNTYVEKNIVLDSNNIPIAFAAIEDFSKDTCRACRILTRTYYMKDFRFLKMTQNIEFGPIGKLLIPYQMNVAKQLNYDLAFVSMETLKKRSVLQSWTDAINLWIPVWSLLDDMYLTCRHTGAESKMKCWQNISCYFFKKVDFILPKMSIDSYKKKFLPSMQP